jgi:succinate dehydrogenase flavin-adding protein (antitoxin of CptAB toxin-antitoxin module)
MLENETILKGFMDTIAVNYPIPKLETLGEILTAISDNDYIDLITGKLAPETAAEIYGAKYIEVLQELQRYVRVG